MQLDVCQLNQSIQLTFSYRRSQSVPDQSIFYVSLSLGGVARAADRGNILELLLKECEGRRVDPSDGQSYDYASFRSCYGADALRLWRRAGELAQQQAKAERTRFRRKVRRSFGTHSANSDRVKQARRQECPYANPLSLEAKRWYQAQMAH